MSKPRDVARILGRTEAANPSNLALGLAGEGGIITQYDSVGLLPVTDLTAGDQAFVTSNSRIYVSNGSGWYNATVANSAPFWDSGYTPASTYEITDSATPLIVTTRASDSDDASVSYSLVSQDSAQYAFVTTQDSGVWTFTPRSADSANANAAAGLLRDSNSTAINVTFRATDGYNILSAPSIITYSWAAATPALNAGTGDTPTQQTGNNGTIFYYGPGADTEASDFFMNLNVTAGSTIGIGLIGGGGAGHHNPGIGGSGGYFVGRVVVPTGISAMTIYAGGRGDYKSGPDYNSMTAPLGGQYGGGNGGAANSVGGTYAKSASGGGYSGLFTGTTSTGGVFANTVVVVGGGGAAGSASASGGYGGAAGNSGGTSGTGGGAPGTVSAGGAGGTRSAGYVTGSGAGAGGQLQGGVGQTSSYEGGGGGGAGYYGGGGGRGGGGYDAGPGGGGSGYKIASGITQDYSDGGNAGTLTAFQNAVRSASGASNFTMPTGSWGDGGAANGGDGKSGFALVWLPV
jgi:hypothetical protein